MGIVFTRRTVGLEDFAMQVKEAVSFDIGTIQYVAGGCGKIGLFVGTVTVSVSLDESGNMTGVSIG